MIKRLFLRYSPATSSLFVEKKLSDGTFIKGLLNPRCFSEETQTSVSCSSLSTSLFLLEGMTQLPDGRVYYGKYDAEKGFPLPGSRLEEDGDLYEGSFNAKWQREGSGKAWLADGTYYEGLFDQDELVNGTVRVPQGIHEVTFKGSLKDESFVQGRLTSNEYVYEGFFHNNEPDGKGKLVFVDTGAEQEGTFRNGKLHGSNCKMKLPSGYVYVGDFLDGHIRYGKLFTPTYTYEGEFNEHGRAHGTGVQTYLIQEPRLIFTGIWNQGAMIQGSVADEYGVPVDWRNDHETQRNILGNGDLQEGEEHIAMNSYCSAKLKEADILHREMQKSYAEDAAKVEKSTGHFPSKMDLRYEGSIREEQEHLHLSSNKQLHDLEQCRIRNQVKSSSLAKNAITTVNAEQVAVSLDENMAKINFSRQCGAIELSAQRAEEQLNRFLRSFPGRSQQTSILDEEDDEEDEKKEKNMMENQIEEDGTDEGDKMDKIKSEQTVADANKNSSTASTSFRLKIHGNSPWKSFTPPDPSASSFHHSTS